jgi:predicted  nucleic acid-binding Zn-ribbon protein
VDQLANIESQIQTLWEKAKQAGDLIARLREEKQSLHDQNETLLQDVARLRAELNAKEQRLASAAHDAESAAIFSNGEREELTAKVKALLAKLGAYL